MEFRREIDFKEKEKIVLLGKAISSPLRLEMLELLEEQAYHVNEIAEILKIPASSSAMHVRVLEEAGLIETELRAATRGSMKVCRKSCQSVLVDFGKPEEGNVQKIHMPIGNFVDYHVEPTCGIVAKEGYIDVEDEPAIFYHPRRTEAKLIWLGKGYLEYRFPNAAVKKNHVRQMEISMELCSEDHEYNMDWASDITLWLNGKEAGTWTCPSDFGGRRGKLNPLWWPKQNTQYGILKKWTVKQQGTWLDGEQVENRGVLEYGLEEGDYISVKIGVKEDAKNQGGLNIFGDCFGDYPQDIILKLTYES
ncbi:ArsR/SmtB family transcription factor [Lachnoclostridium sp. An181]|uniref:ArsR/SmtB family transcription factor n=1 Tax=Lachnoclostridium sp. An181 TaxID=1965575 RepID=UPI000B365035|nr:ArsR family transcriptional regulator [Lachnoclostridium sp. An181]OUP48748.1 ArsR family transcriptional regulator [Lachnoclostridium sp. An181]